MSQIFTIHTMSSEHEKVGTATEVKAYLEQALASSGDYLRSKLALIESELKTRAAVLDVDVAEAKHNLSEQFESKLRDIESKSVALKNEILELKKRLQEEFEQKKREITEKALRNFESMIENLFDNKFLPLLKSSVIDPDMP